MFLFVRFPYVFVLYPHPHSGILSDLFPGVSIPEHDYGVLHSTIVECLVNRNLQPLDSMINKVLLNYFTRNRLKAPCLLYIYLVYFNRRDRCSQWKDKTIHSHSFHLMALIPRSIHVWWGTIFRRGLKKCEVNSITKWSLYNHKTENVQFDNRSTGELLMT